MLDAWIPPIVRELHAAGLSGREIARRLDGCAGRGSIQAILAGRRPAQSPPDDDQDQAAAGPPVRCGGCGGLVTLPCLVCHIRLLVRLHRIHRPFADSSAGDPDDLFALDFGDDDAARKRYEVLHQFKQHEAADPVPPADEEAWPPGDFPQVMELGGCERDPMGEPLCVDDWPADEPLPPTAGELREALQCRD